MIGLLDPALFLPLDTKRRAEEVQRELDLVARICKDHNVALIPLEEYWNDLWAALGRPLEQQLPAHAKRSIQELRKLGERASAGIPPLPAQSGKVWRRGFSQLFGAAALPSSAWEERMMRAALRALAAQHDVVVLTRRVPGRNIRIHTAGGTTLEEITRWRLFVQPKDIGPRQILCIHHPRNIEEPWTTRFDWRLPSADAGAAYPFCPPQQWWKPSIPAFDTVRSKPAWIDTRGNGWARPNISGGAGYHWDVFIESPNLRKKVGLDAINVVQFGAPPREGTAGTIHHTPRKKRGGLTQTGWVC